VILVHLIAPNGKRWQREFADGTSDAKILSQFAASSRHFGRTGFILKSDEVFAVDNGAPVPHPDPASPLVWDHPDTVVAVGVAVDRQFVEQRRLKGPPLPTPVEPAAPTPVEPAAPES